jgi:RNA polymerase sigma-70 factor, ECF subfamily
VSLAAAYRAAIGPEVAAPDGLDERLAALVSEARAPWPPFGLEPETFVRHLAQKVSATQPLEQLRPAELYLACACAEGNAVAIATIEERYFFDRSGTLKEELQQVLREQLFVARDGSKPRIAEYSGRGELGAWLRVSAVRAAIKLSAREGRYIPTDGEDELIGAMPSPEGTPELELIKSTHRRDFKLSFAEAFTALSSREQNLLRHHYVDALTVDDIGAMYQMHRATAARWIARARARLFSATRKGLMARLGLSQAECHSMIRLIRSRLDISIRRLVDPEG